MSPCFLDKRRADRDDKVTWLKNAIKETPIANSDAEKFKARIEEDIVNLAKIVELHKIMKKQWEKAIELSQQLDKADTGHPNCCAGASKASALAYLDLLW